MLKATFRSFLAHKGRLALSMLAVLLSVAFVAGTLMFTDTIGSTFDELFRSTSPDVSVTAHNDVAGRNDQNFSGTVPTVPESLIPTVRQVPGVASVVGRVQLAGIVLTDANNKSIGAIGGAPTIGINWDLRPNSPVDLTSGSAPHGDGQVVVDADTVHKHHLVLGQQLHVIAATGGFPVTLTGIATFNTTNPGATLVFLDTPTAQTRLLGHAGVFTSIDLTADKGVTHEQLRDRVAPVVGSAYDVKTAEQTAKDAAQTLGAFLSVIKDALLGFAGIAVLVGVSLILNTFSMLVAQRTRELGLMRALGASREQVNRSVLVEAALLGLVGSTLGLLLGVALALGLIKLIAAGGMVLKGSQLAVHWPTIVAAYAVGIIVTTVSAYLPARRASRISPMAALREADTPGRGAPLRVRAVVGLVVLAVATGALVGAATDKNLGQAGLLLGAGVLLSLVGLIVVGPLLARPVIRAIGGWFPRVFGPVGTLSQRNALRNPRRTSATASALMIGLALVASLSIVGSSLAASFDAQIDKTIGADLIVQNSTGLPFPNEVGDTVEATPGVGLAVRGQGTRGALVAADGTQQKTVVVGTSPGLEKVVRIEMRAGTVAAGTAPGHVMIGSNYADAHGLHLGSPVNILFQSGQTGTLTVGGIDVTDTNPGGLGDEPVLATSTLRQYVPGALDDIVFVNVAPGADKAQVKSALTTALAKDPQVQVRDQTDYKKLIRGQIDLLLNLVYGLLALAIIIAILGVVNTLALSVIERTREIGLLRAIGLGRAQLRRMVRLEAVVISLFGAVLGLGLGLGWGLTAQRLLAAKGLQALAIPWATIIAVVVGAAVVGLLAALGPALRASRLDVLDAIAHE
ncbi:ABC transporter permease [Streptacidiphilus jiangxiensis]|uniref:Putative ABC transport system permease protein n=1 Tax=Streptacidiphilus jiangxiensis TaxID=235985 RepID=A0A1H7U4G5_STRJI|nr:ABC transporter permease [Streptacidiphilus jiangxiensis]SEL91694.1 putative ABC transport system permease protein [Streptacidiphilus jiangxiensis]